MGGGRRVQTWAGVCGEPLETLTHLFLDRTLKKDVPYPIPDRLQIRSAVADLTLLKTCSVHGKHTQFKIKVNSESV